MSKPGGSLGLPLLLPFCQIMSPTSLPIYILEMLLQQWYFGEDKGPPFSICIMSTISIHVYFLFIYLFSLFSFTLIHFILLFLYIH
ncbi:hypothetical protein Lalb_Chr18g0046611 [Lupinus albus]|uniref:Uncharacterized protein n=1 Tax=Lupinus albus TaxID=3870 RepID=A0A6A4NX77_LUPAL|nr:hypothetical protein Lalb_Chr18g0046611 [Lupinus albus]